MALTNVWMMRITPKTGDATQQRVMMFTPHHLRRLLLQLCSRACFVLYNSEPLHDPAALPEPAPTGADSGKSDSGAEENAWRKTMSPKELLDTMLGYLGFVVDIDETNK